MLGWDELLSQALSWLRQRGSFPVQGVCRVHQPHLPELHRVDFYLINNNLISLICGITDFFHRLIFILMMREAVSQARFQMSLQDSLL